MFLSHNTKSGTVFLEYRHFKSELRRCHFLFKFIHSFTASRTVFLQPFHPAHIRQMPDGEVMEATAKFRAIERYL